MIPQRFAPVVFGLLLSGVMSLVVSGVASLRALGPVPGFASLWAGAWLTSWLIAFPAVLIAAPLVRRVVEQISAKPTNPVA